MSTKITISPYSAYAIAVKSDGSLVVDAVTVEQMKELLEGG